MYDESVNRKYLSLPTELLLKHFVYLGLCHIIITVNTNYFAYFQTIMNCPIIFKGKSSYCKNIVILKKKIIRIMVGAKSRNSRRGLCERLDTIPLLHEYFINDLCSK